MVRSEAGRLLVRARSVTDCPRCAQGRGCGGGLWAGLLGDRLHEVSVVTSGSEPEPGARVTIGLAESAVLRGAALAYLPPLAGLLIGAVSASAGDDLAAAAGAVLGLGGGLLLSRAMGRWAGSDPSLHPVLLARIEDRR